MRPRDITACCRPPGPASLSKLILKPLLRRSVFLIRGCPATLIVCRDDAYHAPVRIQVVPLANTDRRGIHPHRAVGSLDQQAGPEICIPRIAGRGMPLAGICRHNAHRTHKRPRRFTAPLSNWANCGYLLHQFLVPNVERPGGCQRALVLTDRTCRLVSRASISTGSLSCPRGSAWITRIGSGAYEPSSRSPLRSGTPGRALAVAGPVTKPRRPASFPVPRWSGINRRFHLPMSRLKLFG